MIMFLSEKTATFNDELEWFSKNQGLSSTTTHFRFDGFTVRSAIEYVFEIFDAMKQTPQRLMNNSEEIVFDTGRGYRLETKAQRIQAAFCSKRFKTHGKMNTIQDVPSCISEKSSLMPMRWRLEISKAYWLEMNERHESYMNNHRLPRSYYVVDKHDIPNRYIC
ncbi:unnamed protein product [Caenorhabditis brenneri]